MDPQQELFSYLLVALKEKYPDIGIYDSFLPPEGTPYPFIYLADSHQTVTPAATDSNTYKYKVGENLDMPVKGQNVKGWTVWDGTSDVTAETGKEIVIAECDSQYKVVGAGKTEVKSKAGA